jgi:hypothetical protein
MTQRRKSLAIAVYGLAVIASGLFSLLGREGGMAGLKFGFVMGGLTLAGACLMWFRQRLLGAPVAWVAVAFVGGWFVYDAFFKRGFGHADFRKYLMIALSLAAVGVLCWPTKRNPVAQQTAETGKPDLREGALKS